jgi:hypothetical protein
MAVCFLSRARGFENTFKLLSNKLMAATAAGQDRLSLRITMSVYPSMDDLALSWDDTFFDLADMLREES